MSAAYITVDAICREWLATNGKHQNSYYKIVLFACQAARQIAQYNHDKSSPRINNVLLKRAKTDLYFRLPKDYSGSYLSVGVRHGDQFQPVTVSERLIPFYSTEVPAGFDDEFDEDFDQGDWVAWLTGTDCTYDHHYGYSYRIDGQIVFNQAKGLILCAPGFGATELYLSYRAAGEINTATQVSYNSRDAILAYIDWQYEKAKKKSTAGLEDAYTRKIRLLRASNNTLNAQFFYDIHASPVWLGRGRYGIGLGHISSGSSYKQETFYGVGTYYKLFKVGNPPGPAPTHLTIPIINGDPIFDPSLANVDVQTVSVAGQFVPVYTYSSSGAITFPTPYTDVYIGVWYTTLAYPKLPTPNLQLQGQPSTSAVLYWDVVPGASEYKLYKRAINNPYGADLIYSGTNLSYTDIQFTAGAPYYFLQALSSIASSDFDTKTITTGYPYIYPV